MFLQLSSCPNCAGSTLLCDGKAGEALFPPDQQRHGYPDLSETLFNHIGNMLTVITELWIPSPNQYWNWLTVMWETSIPERLLGRKLSMSRKMSACLIFVSYFPDFWLGKPCVSIHFSACVKLKDCFLGVEAVGCSGRSTTWCCCCCAFLVHCGQEKSAKWNRCGGFRGECLRACQNMMHCVHSGEIGSLHLKVNALAWESCRECETTTMMALLKRGFQGKLPDGFCLMYGQD